MTIVNNSLKFVHLQNNFTTWKVKDNRTLWLHRKNLSGVSRQCLIFGKHKDTITIKVYNKFKCNHWKEIILWNFLNYLDSDIWNIRALI